MAAYLLDTGVLIRHLRGQRAAVRLLRSLGRKDRLAISAVTRAEVRAGMRDHEDHTTRRLLSRLETVPIGPEIADRAGDLVREVARVVGGKGGGRADFAQTGGKDASKLEAAFERLESLIAEG